MEKDQYWDMSYSFSWFIKFWWVVTIGRSIVWVIGCYFGNITTWFKIICCWCFGYECCWWWDSWGRILNLFRIRWFGVILNIRLKSWILHWVHKCFIYYDQGTNLLGSRDKLSGSGVRRVFGRSILCKFHWYEIRILGWSI